MQDSYNQFVGQNRQLATFLSFFADADLVGLTDIEVAHQFSSTKDNFRQTILVKAKSLMEDDPFPWQHISECANRYFASEAEARSWLMEIIMVVEEN